MNFKKVYIILITLVTTFFCINSVYAEDSQTKSYMKDGKYYIEKIYTLKNTEDITSLMGNTFELNGYTYHQVDLKSEPYIEKLTKNITEPVEVKVSSQSTSQVISGLGETKVYSDDEGYNGTLSLNKNDIQYTATGYTTKSYTKTDTKIYYGLSSMDTSQIVKTIWSGGVAMTLYDIEWIGDNNLGTGDTAIGNNYNAKAFYSGTYDVKTPNGYIAKTSFNGTVEKEFSDKIIYTITYIGEKVEPQVIEIEENENDLPLWFIVMGIVFFIILLSGLTILFKIFKRNKNNNEISDIDFLEDTELKENMEANTDEKN
ncbi:hypothetical protein B5E58_04505 [Tyzzerella sp. An114]|uniref:hypothetical protein n=1 Tax=Tyzzerella sp. An114 TaxID=1965545 RepID=UPI000B433DDE|nr:hypothetical protein [Tyzzerella sp. An114]OUQ59701.1 hypothetical protein B5E58_04505 [Tyzzerella sp. An114]